MPQLRSYDFGELVARQVESDELDYKSAMSWRTMTRQEKGKLVRHLTAFANTRGGFLVIGVGENESGVPSLRTGVTEEQAGSFDPTPVGNFVNAHIEPAIDFTIERPVVDGRRYVIFVVRPFKHLPHVCSRGVEGELQEGMFYIRTAEASSRPARRAFEMQELIRRSMRNEREQLGRILRGILYESRQLPGTESSRLSDMALDAERYFRNRRGTSGNGAFMKFFIIPDSPLDTAAGADELRRILSASLWPCGEPEFVCAGEVSAARGTPGSLRFLAQDKPRMWQFFDCGLFCFFRCAANEELTMEMLARFCAEAVGFAGHLGERLNWSEELLTLRLALIPSGEAVIDGTYRSQEKEISAEIKRSAADLTSGRENHAARLLRRIGEQFRIPDKKLDHLQPAISNFLERR